jgi:predicted HTH transcriptional regulator
MTTSLKELIKQGENHAVEFKKTISSPQKIAKTLCAFANSHGGYILVGVADNKEIIGIEPEEEKFILLEAAQHHCIPPVTIQFQEEQNKEQLVILIVLIPKSNNKPHAIVDSTGTEKIYVRSGAHCLIAAPSVIKTLKNEFEEQSLNLKLTQNKKILTLTKHLHKKQKITVKEYAKLINVSKQRAKKILNECRLSGLLYEHSFQKDSFFTLAKPIN